ncbi:MAG: hypothetical protein R2882_13605 [Gemmatimonadales bacterium]
MIPFPLADVRPAFHAAAIAFVPDLAAAGAGVWATLEAIVAQALADRPPAVVRQLRLFVRVVDLLSRLRYGRSLVRLDVGHRAALLATLERSPVLLLRRGVWGLRTLVLMGYYTQPAIGAALGYAAHANGWADRR